MKGTSGLILAIFLGALAMLLNWAYLENKRSEIKTVSLAGIAAGTKLDKGETLREEHLQEIQIPAANATSLASLAYLYEDRKSLIGMRTLREYQEGDLILRRDYRTLPAEITLAQDERLIWIPVDSRSFVPELLNPGDDVTFLVPLAQTTSRGEAASASEESEEPAETASLLPTAPLAPSDAFGPFRVASIGSRLASQSLASASRTATMQDRQVGIIVKAKNQSLEPRALQLLDRLQRNDYRQVSVVLHPRSLRGEP